MKADAIKRKPSGALSWILAARPKTLTAAFVPVLVGTCLADLPLEAIRWSLAFFALMSSFFIQIGTNLINDALDFKKGADTPQRLGPSRVTQQGWLSSQQVLGAGLFCFALAAFFCIPLIYQGGIWFFALLIVSLLCGYLYTGGPAPLAYVGLGDIFVLLFFGFASTVSTYFLQMEALSYKPFLAGLQIGLLATALIAINNLRDCDEDTKSHKRTLAVRFGKTFARLELTLLLTLPFLLGAIWYAAGYVWSAFLPLLLLPMAVRLLRAIWKTEPSIQYNAFLAQSAFLQLGFGILFVIGYRI